MTLAPSAATQHPAGVPGRAGFVRRSLWVLAGAPLLALLATLAFPPVLAETLLVALALAAPWVLAALAWRYGSRYAARARWAWRALAVLLALLGLAVVAGAAYLMLLGSAFGRA
jgi:hypothetical protein